MQAAVVVAVLTSTAARRTARRATLLLPPTGVGRGFRGCRHPQHRRCLHRPSPHLPVLLLAGRDGVSGARGTETAAGLSTRDARLALLPAPPPPPIALCSAAPLRPSRAARRRDGCRGGNCVIVSVCIVCGVVVGPMGTSRPPSWTRLTLTVGGTRCGQNVHSAMNALGDRLALEAGRRPHFLMCRPHAHHPCACGRPVGAVVPRLLRIGTPPQFSDLVGGRLQVELSTVIYTIVSRVHHRSSVIYSYLHIVSRVHHRSRVIYHYPGQYDISTTKAFKRGITARGPAKSHAFVCPKLCICAQNRPWASAARANVFSCFFCYNIVFRLVHRFGRLFVDIT